MRKTKEQPQQPGQWKSRIVGHAKVAPDQLVANPLNFRTHPMQQREALKAAIDDLGFCRSVTVNKRTGNLVDGHERVWQAMTSEQPTIDVEYIDVSEEEERKILATLDPIGELANVDGAKLNELLDGLLFGGEALQQMLSDLTPAQSFDFAEPPESVAENAAEIEEIKRQRKEGNADTASKMDTEKYLVVVFADRESKQKVLKDLGLPEDERYVPASSITMKSRGFFKSPIAESGRKTKAASSKKSGAGG